MEKTLNKGKGSHYDMTFVVTEKDLEDSKEKILKNFQKDLALPGFRKGFAPMDKVQENINPEYLTIGIYENVINDGLHEIIKENPTIRFIGEPYDIKQNKKDENTEVTLKLDIFPEVTVINEDRKTHKIKKIEAGVEKKEVEEAIDRLKKNYADYKDAETITESTIAKLALKYLDKEGVQVDQGHTYLGEPEFAEFPFFKTTFVGKKKNDVFEIPYDSKTLPPVLLSKKVDIKVAKIEFTVQDVKEIILPEMTDAMLEKLFGKDSEVKNEKDLSAFVEKSLADQKFDTELIKKVEELLQTIRGKSLAVEIPHTLIQEEQKSRIANLEKRFGSKEKIEEYFKKIGEEKAKEFMDDITKAAQESLEKFFVLQKLVQLLELDINREKTEHLEIEKKLYEKLKD